MYPKYSVGVVFSILAIAASQLAHASENGPSNNTASSDYRCVLGSETSQSSVLEGVKAVTLKPGEDEAKVVLGPNQKVSEDHAGIARLKAECDKAMNLPFLNRKDQCLAELEKRKADAPNSYPAQIVLKLVREIRSPQSIMGFVDEEKAKSAWYYDRDLPLNQGRTITAVIGTEFSGIGFSGFKRHFGFSFRDNLDHYSEYTINDDMSGDPKIEALSGMGRLILTCSRVDGKFNSVKAQ